MVSSMRSEPGETVGAGQPRPHGSLAGGWHGMTAKVGRRFPGWFNTELRSEDNYLSLQASRAVAQIGLGCGLFIAKIL